MATDRPIVWSVGGGSGEFTRPYRIDGGYDVRVVDPIAFPFWRASDIPAGKAHIVILAPPCTEFAGSGARWWKGKAANKPWLLVEAIAIVREMLAVLDRTDPDIWALENPSGRIARMVPELGKAAYSYQPWQYGTPETKRTCMWGNHTRPTPTVLVKPEKVTARVHLMPPGDKRAFLRSKTTEGFAQAFFEANR